MNNTRQYAEHEFALLVKNATNPDDRPLIEKYIPELLQIAEKFGISNEAANGTAASYTAQAITAALEKVLMQKPITPITGQAEEWVDVTQGGGVATYQNSRLAGLFRIGEKGTPYYLDAIVFKRPDGSKFTGEVQVMGEKLKSRQYVNLPFRPKTFYVDVIPVNRGKGKVTEQEWRVKDKNQLVPVFKYYRKEIPATN